MNSNPVLEDNGATVTGGGGGITRGSGAAGGITATRDRTVRLI